MQRRRNLLGLRWVIFLWLCAYVAYVLTGEPQQAAIGLGLLALMALSQVVLWRMGPQCFESLRLPQIIFLFDINLVVCGLWLLGRFHVGLLVAVFLTVFMAAMVQRVKSAVLVGAMAAGVYLGWRLYTPEGFQALRPEQLLELPLMLVMAIHASILIEFSRAEESLRRGLELDRRFLKNRLKQADRELDEVRESADEMFDMLPLGVILIDNEGCVLSVNHYAEMVLGQARRFVLGQQTADVAAIRPLEAVLTKGRDRRAEDLVEMVDESKEPALFRVEAFPVRRREGKRLGVLAIVLPVTTRYMAEAQALQARGDWLEAHLKEVPPKPVPSLVSKPSRPRLPDTHGPKVDKELLMPL